MGAGLSSQGAGLVTGDGRVPREIPRVGYLGRKSGVVPHPSDPGMSANCAERSAKTHVEGTPGKIGGNPRFRQSPAHGDTATMSWLPPPPPSDSYGAWKPVSKRKHDTAFTIAMIVIAVVVGVAGLAVLAAVLLVVAWNNSSGSNK